MEHPDEFEAYGDPHYELESEWSLPTLGHSIKILGWKDGNTEGRMWLKGLSSSYVWKNQTFPLSSQTEMITKGFPGVRFDFDFKFATTWKKGEVKIALVDQSFGLKLEVGLHVNRHGLAGVTLRTSTPADSLILGGGMAGSFDVAAKFSQKQTELWEVLNKGTPLKDLWELIGFDGSATVPERYRSPTVTWSPVDIEFSQGREQSVELAKKQAWSVPAYWLQEVIDKAPLNSVWTHDFGEGTVIIQLLGDIENGTWLQNSAQIGTLGSCGEGFGLALTLAHWPLESEPYSGHPIEWMVQLDTSCNGSNTVAILEPPLVRPARTVGE